MIATVARKVVVVGRVSSLEYLASTPVVGPAW